MSSSINLIFCCAKGQIITKRFFYVFDLLQKANENKSTWVIILVKSNFFVRFLEEIEDIKNLFEIITTYPIDSWGRKTLHFCTEKPCKRSFKLKTDWFNEYDPLIQAMSYLKRRWVACNRLWTSIRWRAQNGQTLWPCIHPNENRKWRSFCPCMK